MTTIGQWHGASWICCQLGAREHYSIPRALHQRGSLARLITDAWVFPRNPLGLAKRTLRERYHANSTMFW